MTKVIMFDPVCPKPYTPGDHRTIPMGGSEGTASRICEAMKWPLFCHTLDGASADVCITLRSAKATLLAKSILPNARHIMWVQDWCSRDEALQGEALAKAGVTVIANSDTELSQYATAYKAHGQKQIPVIRRIYNPADPLTAEYRGRAYDKHRLFFASSPHKGLPDALRLFSLLRAYDSNYRLRVANPGYRELPAGLEMEGVEFIGPQTPDKVYEEMSQSLCLFFPNKVFPETFGIVFAEADAIGCPVLTHPCGAAPEILDHPSEMVDTNDPEAVIKRVVAWTSGNRPIVGPKPEYAFGTVLAAWKREVSR